MAMHKHEAFKVVMKMRPKKHGEGKIAMSTAAMEAQKKAMHKFEPGEGGRFATLKASLEKRGGVRNPAAVAASIGRRKFGKKKFQQLALKGRKSS